MFVPLTALERILQIIGHTYVHSGESYLMTQCPVAGINHSDGQDRRPSCSLGHTDRPTRFKCFTCGFDASIREVAFMYYRKRVITPEEYVEIDTICKKSYDANINLEDLERKLKANPEPTSVLLDESELDLYEKSVTPWLLNRNPEPEINITMETCKKWGIRYSKDEKMVVIPVYDKEGLRGITKRNTQSSGSKYLSSKGFRNHHFLFGMNHFADVCSLPTKGGIILVEGQFDVMYMHQLGYTNTLGLFSANITTQQVKILERFEKPLTFFLDNDKAGQKGLERARCMISKHIDVYVVRYPDSIPEKADPKRLSSDTINELLTNSEYVV